MRASRIVAWAVLALVVAAPAAAAQPGPAEAYHTYPTLKEDVQALVAEHPDRARYRVVGTSVAGLEIFTVDVARNISDRSPEELADLPTLYVDGGHHGNEQLSIEAVYLFLSDVLSRTADDPSKLDGKRLTVTPVVNPDGYVRDFRTNSRQVDLNRNYPFHWGRYGTSDQPASFTYRGPAPASEPETRTTMDVMDDMDVRAYLSGHTGTYDIVLPWRQSQDGEIPDWPMYEAYLGTVEDETGLPYRDPSGAGESTAWGYGNRTALSVVVEVSTEQFAPATQGTIRDRLSEVLQVYEIAWGNLTRLQGHLEVVGSAPGQVTVENTGWAPAYNVSLASGTETVAELAPGETATLEGAGDGRGTEVTYRRVRIPGDDAALGIESVPVALDGPAAGPAGAETTPGPGLAAALVGLLAGLAVLGRR